MPQSLDRSCASLPLCLWLCLCLSFCLSLCHDHSHPHLLKLLGTPTPTLRRDAQGRPVLGEDGRPLFAGDGRRAANDTATKCKVGPGGALLDGSGNPILGEDGQPLTLPPCSIGPGGIVL